MPGLNAVRLGLHPLADRCRDMTKLSAKLAGRVINIAVKELDARNSEAWDNGDISRRSYFEDYLMMELARRQGGVQ